MKKWQIILIAIIFIGIISSAMSGGDDKPKAPATPDTSVSTDVPNSKAEQKEADSTDDNVPAEHKSALKKANDYSNTMHMSKTGIYDQLTSEYGEKFSPEAAQYAIDNLEADWNKNALAKAKDYSNTMHMSKIGVYNQLTSENGEKFTAEEAQYAIDNVKADWNANALAKAKDYQDTMAMSPEAIRDQLTSEYGEQFTAEEAEYAIANLD